MDQKQRSALRRAFRLIAVAATLGGLFLFEAAAMAATPTPTGAALVTEPDAATPLTTGGSATPFTLVIPVNSHCSGDTAHMNFHVYTYITSMDPGTESFAAGTGPTNGFPLYAILSQGQAQQIDQQTAPNSGNVGQEPTMDFSLFSIDGSNGKANPLPAGTYNVGVACATATGVLDNFWNVQIVFSASSSDPNGEVWSVPATTTTTSSSSPTSSSSSSVPDSSTTSTSSTLPGGSSTTTTATTVAGGTSDTSSTVTGTLAASGAGPAVATEYLWGGFLLAIGFVFALLAGWDRRTGSWR